MTRSTQWDVDGHHGGNGDLTFTGILDHGPFTPTIQGVFTP
jgi:hypothetical protein